MNRAAGLTFIELLTVVLVIVIVAAMLLPALAQTTRQARKATCATNLNNLGKTMAMYMVLYDSYPHFGPRGMKIIGASAWRGYAWPKIYASLEMCNLAGTYKTTWGVWAYLWEGDEIFELALCPAMDAAAVLKWSHDAAEAGRSPADRPAMHRAAIGYTWNICLRAAAPRESGSWRWPATLSQARRLPEHDSPIWCDWVMNLPRGAYGAQAVTDEELSQASEVAEAWDSCDVETAPNVNFAGGGVENLMPGWHVGPMSRGTKGWAVLNGARHAGSPNILYADGHVAADATRKLKPGDLGACPSGSWDGIRANSWPEYDRRFGTLLRIVPKWEFSKEEE